MKTCKNCNSKYDKDVEFCSVCGNKLEKKSRVKKICCITGVACILGNIINFPSIDSIIGILFGISLLPIIYEKINIIKYKKSIKIILPILLLFIWSTVLPSEALEYININDENITIAVNESYEINFNTNLTSTKKENFLYKSSNENIAKVENGTIYGISEGEVTIEIIGEENITSSANYVITYIDLESIELSGDTRLIVGDTGKLEVTLQPVNTSDKYLSWKSENPEIISVTENGEIKANSRGKTTITAISEKGISKTIEITSYVPIDSIEISPTELTIEKGKTGNLLVNILPANADNDGISWKSSNENIATVENGIVTGKSIGKTIITATSLNGKEASCNIEVKEILAESIDIKESSLELKVGNISNASVSIFPDNTTNKNIEWLTSDSDVVVVSEGKITAVGIGTATITAKTSNGKTDILPITVTEQAPIKINNFAWTRDYVGGIEWTFSITNNSPKTINYVTITWNNYNAIGDPVYDEITGKTAYTLLYTGPINSGKTTKRIRNTRLFYSFSYNKSLLSEITITYADGTIQTISTSEMKYYTNLI